MSEILSQSYGVDNRYAPNRGAVDNFAGQNFLQSYLSRRRDFKSNPIGNDRLFDDRFFFAGQGGTVPIGAIGLGQQIGNTDAGSRFRNLFRADQNDVNINPKIEVDKIQPNTNRDADSETLYESNNRRLREAYRKRPSSAGT